MYRVKITTVIMVTIFLINYCGDKNLQEFDITKLGWFDDFGYSRENLFPLYMSSGSKYPQVEISIGGRKVKLLIDFLFNDIIINERLIKSSEFEAQRIYTKIFLSKEMMFEEGYLHDVEIFGVNYPLLYILLLKKSDMKLNSDGIIGKRFFTDKIVTLDFKNGIIGIKDNVNGMNIQTLQDSGYRIVRFVFDRSAHTELVNALKIKGKIRDKEIYLTFSTLFDESLISPELVNLLTGRIYTKHRFVIDTLTIDGLILSKEDLIVNDKVMDLSYTTEDLIHICLGCDVLKDKVATISLSDSLLIIK